MHDSPPHPKNTSENCKCVLGLPIYINGPSESLTITHWCSKSPRAQENVKTNLSRAHLPLRAGVLWLTIHQLKQLAFFCEDLHDVSSTHSRFIACNSLIADKRGWIRCFSHEQTGVDRVLTSWRHAVGAILSTSKLFTVWKFRASSVASTYPIAIEIFNSKVDTM